MAVKSLRDDVFLLAVFSDLWGSRREQWTIGLETNWLGPQYYMNTKLTLCQFYITFQWKQTKQLNFLYCSLPLLDNQPLCPALKNFPTEFQCCHQQPIGEKEKVAGAGIRKCLALPYITRNIHLLLQLDFQNSSISIQITTGCKGHQELVSIRNCKPITMWQQLCSELNVDSNGLQ